MSVSAVLTVLCRGIVLKEQKIEESILVGRGKECGIRLDDRSISRQHVFFKCIDENIQVENKSEFSPIYLNGIEVVRAVLKEGDTVSIGPYSITFSLEKIELSKKKVEKSVQSENSSFSQDSWNEKSSLENKVLEQVALSEDSRELNKPKDLEAKQVDLNAPLEGIEGIESLPSQEVSQIISEDGKTKIASKNNLIAKLFFEASVANFTEFEIKKNEVVIGRGDDCDIILNDKKASKKNSKIIRSGVQFYVQDLNSSNGTYVNQRKIDKQFLSDGDFIKIGSIEFKFKANSVGYEEKKKEFLEVKNEPEVDSSVSLLNKFENSFSKKNFDFNTSSPLEIKSEKNNPYNGISGISSNAQKKTILEKFRTLPKRTQFIAVIAIVLFLSWLNEDDETVSFNKKKNTASVQGKALKKENSKDSEKNKAKNSLITDLISFDSLPEDKKKFIETQHDIAFEYYKNKEYDKSIFEIQKIYPIISDYKDSKEIERYAKEGKRKLEAIDDEKRKKEEEVKFKEKIFRLVEETRIKIENKQFEQAKESFSEILSLDPDNASVALWKKKLDEIEEKKRLKQQQDQIQLEINQRAFSIYKEALNLKKLKKYHSAIHFFQKAIDIGAADTKVLAQSKKMIKTCYTLIQKSRDPFLILARKSESQREYMKAYMFYQKAMQVDPLYPEGYKGIKRMKSILHDRAKVVYTEAILAESYSDFQNAKKMFQECLNIAPKDDLYYERAQRKLARYFKNNSEEIFP